MRLCFRVHATDNVATLLEDAEPGACQVIGEGASGTVTLLDPIPRGHKVCLDPLARDAPIFKYGIVIGRANQEIHSGQHVHLHNCRSLFDQRSSGFDNQDGSPTDTPYE